MLPLIGGSGGGGGGGGVNFTGGAGGGGGGAILIAASGTLTVTGAILANGAAGGDSFGDGAGSMGGGGSGGAIRLMATSIAGNGTISAVNSGVPATRNNWTTAGYTVCGTSNGGATTGLVGSSGRIRLEAETITRTAATTPSASIGVPGALFVSGLPGLVITSVAGVAAPAAPTGVADITLPANTANPVTVTFTTTGVPVGNTVKLTVTPQYGQTSSAISPALTGTTESATASVQITLPAGPSTLQAQTTYTIVAALGDALSTYANNERVEKVTLTAALGKLGTVTLITTSGKEFEVPAAVLAQAQEKLRG
ncbi:hypothetical protein CBW56_11725 [Denitratisoma oestradiolicum]|nr:hypothetical protein CBW56_11725 [Denitratisoma oestradiolicum]